MSFLRKILQTRPRTLGFVLASIIGLSSLFVYQNCGMPDPKQSSASEVNNDFYRWMPDTVVSAACVSPATTFFPSIWVLTQSGQHPVSAADPLPAGIRLSSNGAAASVGKGTDEALKGLPQQAIYLAALSARGRVNQSTHAFPGEQWGAAFDVPNGYPFQTSQIASNKTLEITAAQGGPANSLILNQTVPFGRSGFYVDTLMRGYVSERNASDVDGFYVGLFFATPQPGQTFVPVLDSLNRPAGSVLWMKKSGEAVTGVTNLEATGNVNSLEVQKYTWKCPSNGNFSSADNNLFMIFNASERVNASATIGPDDIKCAVDETNQGTTFANVPAELKSELRFGVIKYGGNYTGFPVNNHCVVYSQTTTDDCYNVTLEGKYPDYRVKSPFDQIAAGTMWRSVPVQAPHFLSICSRLKN